jgi:hypothetical protein
MGQLVHDGRDAFLLGRSWNFGLVVLCTGTELRKRGGTELIDLADGWKSMDTLSAHTYWLHFGFFSISCKHSETPIGYATAHSLDGLDDSSVDYAGSRSSNPIASSFADSTVANGFAPLSVTGGAIPAFYDISAAAIKNSKEDPRTSMAIRVTKPGGKQRFSGGSSVVKPGGRLDLYAGKLAGSESAALSRSEVYFERPDGNNKLLGREEYGNLFNPYWQTRLAPVTAAQRAAAQALQGLTLP